MKKTIFIMAAALAALTGCNKNGTDTEGDGFTIDGSAHTITFSIDNPVETFWITDSQTSNTIEATLDEEAEVITCEGKWFSAKVNLGSSKEITLTVDENTSDKERELIISAYHRGKSGSMFIVQEAQ
jgi:hypothetical protein